MRIFLALVFVLIFQGQALASTLSDAASALSAGSWVEIATTNEESVLETDSGTYDILDNYSSQMVYDPNSDAVYYTGCSHHSDFDCKVVKFDISTNTWSQVTGWSGFPTNTPGANSVTHGYDSSAMDNRRGVYYFTEYKEASGGPVIEKYTISTTTWSTISSPGLTATYVQNGFGYFSTIDRLVVIGAWDGGNEIAFYDLNAGSWDAILTSGVPNLGDLHGQAADLPKHGLFIFGGGNDTDTLYKMDRNKTITSIGNPTGSLNINVNSDSDTACYFLADPVSGDLLLFHDNGNLYSWNPTDGWANTGNGSKMGINSSVAGHAGVSIPKYGVTMAVRRDGTDVEVWLYRHATPDTSLPLTSPLPTIFDEMTAYTAWGWNYSGAVLPNTVTDPYVGTYDVTSTISIHSDMEGDDLWMYGHQFDRGGRGPVYDNRRNQWYEYFQGGSYLTDLNNATTQEDDDGFGGDHFFLYGLLYEYKRNGDSAALTAANNLGTWLIDMWDTGDGDGYSCLASNGCLGYDARRIGRHLIAYTELYDATGTASYATYRDLAVTNILASETWNATYGMYFRTDTNWYDSYVYAGAYADGKRCFWPSGIATLAQGMYNAYLQTSNATLKTRIIAMADYVILHGLDDTYDYAGYVTCIDVDDGQEWIDGGTPTDPNYTTDLVNLLVMAYKLTGTASYYTWAKYFFNRGTKGVYGSSTERLCADDEVHHFVDTLWDSSSSYFWADRNKTELFYTYMIFENGGAPTVIEQSSSSSIVFSSGVNPGLGVSYGGSP